MSMFRRLQSLTPPFLRNLDRTLLTHMPALWASRFHMAIFWGLAVAGTAMLRAFVMPMHAYDLPTFELHFWLLMLPLAGGWLYWAWQGHLFNVERTFGEVRPAQEILAQVLVLGGTALFAATPFLYTQELIRKADTLVSAKQLQQDIIALNQGHRFFCLHPDEIVQWQTRETVSLPYPQSIWSLESPGEDQLLTPPADKAAALQRIAAYKAAFARYSGQEIPTADEALYAAYQRGETAVNFEDMEQQGAVSHHLDVLTGIKNHTFFTQDRDLILFWAFFVAAAGLAMTIFMKTSLKVFMLASLSTFLALGTTLTAGALFINLTNMGSNAGNTLMFALMLGLYAFFLRQTYRSRLSQKWEWWPVSSLVAVTLATTLLPVAGLYFFTEVLGMGLSFHGAGGAPSLWIPLFAASCILCGYLGWNLVFRRRLAVLHALPRVK